MSESQANPFGASESTSLPTDNVDVQVFPDASNSKRFLNYLLDLFFFYLSAAIFGVVIAIVLSIGDADSQTFDQFAESGMSSLFGIVLYMGYYVFFEGLLGMTPGKLITGTRVVSAVTHEKAKLGAVMLRTLVRLIPFEPFSFASSGPGGWHDTWSKTRTVDKRKQPLTLEEYSEMQTLKI